MEIMTNNAVLMPFSPTDEKTTLRAERARSYGHTAQSDPRDR